MANAFDAFATRAFVYIPGRFAEDRLIVWDDGDSMDLDELHRLWWIARSPKGDGERRLTREGTTRLLIGKFGIGKLASYAVGHRMTHLCRRNDRFLRVTVDYRGVPSLEDKEEPPRLETPILELTESEAREYTESLFRELPTAMNALWGGERWTLAVVDEIKTDVKLTQGRLAWVIGNGMPLRPDFRVFVNDDEIKPRLAEGAATEWDLSSTPVREQLRTHWNYAVKNDQVEGDIEFLDPRDGKQAAVVFPALGEVRASVRVFRESLIRGRAADLGRSHGFFIMVRGRLLNAEDDKFLLTDPSFGTFYRSQFVIEADALDSDLLADRERLRRMTPRTRELEVVQRALYLAARDRVGQLEEKAAAERDSASLLPVESREHFREPLSALLLRHDRTPQVDVASAKVERAPLGEEEPLAVFDYETGGFKVNEGHPLIEILITRLGGGQTAREALRAFDLVAVSERLLEGFLFDLGLQEEQIDRILAWREGLFRSFASRLQGAREDVIRRALEASYGGDRDFEDALAELFRFMGFHAVRDGSAGEKDVLVVAPIGMSEYSFTVEAKGSGAAVDNRTAHVAGADSHRERVGAKFAVIVAREFAGFKRAGQRPAILQECDATDGRVTIASLDVVSDLCEAVREFSYPLDMVAPVLRPVESPTEKRQRVSDLDNPTEDFDFRGLLDEIWALQRGAASGDIVPYRQIYQSRDEWKKMGFDDFERRLTALEVLARGLLRVSTRNETVSLLQSPEITAERIQRSLDERD